MAWKCCWSCGEANANCQQYSSSKPLNSNLSLCLCEQSACCEISVLDSLSNVGLQFAFMNTELHSSVVSGEKLASTPIPSEINYRKNSLLYECCDVIAKKEMQKT